MKKFCPDCGFERPLEDFYNNPTGVLGKQTYCKTHDRERCKKAKRKRRQNSLQRFDIYLRETYHITYLDYFHRLCIQNLKCAICQTLTPGRNQKHFCVDHNHNTGQIRGLLCHRCNSGLGLFNESPRCFQKCVIICQHVSI